MSLAGAVLASWLALSGGEVQEAPRELKVRLVEVINADRQAAGLPPVEYSEGLSKAADAHCREMVIEDYASHWNRAGWKPYLRYASTGIRLTTSENIHAFWSTHFRKDELWTYLLEGHRGFMAEQPPNDGHRRSVLGEQHTHVGIGVAFDGGSLRMIEAFGGRHADLEPLPARAKLKDSLLIRGRLLRSSDKLLGIEVFYEPLPQPMTHEELKNTFSYGLPDERRMERVRVSWGHYSDGTLGSILTSGNLFQAAVPFWKRKPGVYTLAVWVSPRGQPAFIGAMTSVIVGEEPDQP